MYISIHLNYYNNSIYKGAQVFYNNKFEENKLLAKNIQNNLNTKRKIKELNPKLYMYNKLNIPGVLIECGFLSNPTDRTNLQNDTYIKNMSKSIVDAIIKTIS